MKPILTTIVVSATVLTLVTLAPVSAATDHPARPKVSVYFPLGATRLTDEAQAVLDETAKNLKQDKPPRVIIVGYGDRDGSEAANYSIAASRASLVEQGLIQRGVSREAIVMTAETSPNPSAANGAVAFIGERRTDIIIEPENTTSF